MRRRSVLLGLVHGPTEVLPLSSSAHTRLLAGEHGSKALEVALHAGSLPALVALAPRPRLWFAGLSVAPAALAGLLWQSRVERLGERSTALGLVAGGAAMVLADRLPQSREEATPADAVAIGCAQAIALIPGVSRTGATFAAARARGLTRDAAWSASREAAVPVVLGATLKTALRQKRLSFSSHAVVAAAVSSPTLKTALRQKRLSFSSHAVVAAAVSSLASIPLARRPNVAACAVWRAGVALALMLRSRS